MVKFRTRYNPGDFSDNEVYEEGSSLTEPGQAESMQDLVARLDRAEMAARIAKNRLIIGDSTKLDDAEIDQLLTDSDLDDAETEKTAMAEVVEDALAMQALSAGSGASNVSGREAEQVKRATTNVTQTGSQVPEPGIAPELTESPRD